MTLTSKARNVSLLYLLAAAQSVLTEYADKAACDKNGCQIVSLDWLVKSSQSGKPVSEQAYLLRPHADENGQDKLTVTTTSTATNTHYGRQAGTKNEGAVTVDHKNEDTESRKGDVGTTKDGKKRDAEQVAGAEDTPKKRTKDTQKASSKFLNVPVDDGLRDEAFYFPGKLTISVSFLICNLHILTRGRPSGLH